LLGHPHFFVNLEYGRVLSLLILETACLISLYHIVLIKVDGLLTVSDLHLLATDGVSNKAVEGVYCINYFLVDGRDMYWVSWVSQWILT
jgi:hypothetical protein